MKEERRQCLNGCLPALLLPLLLLLVSLSRAFPDGFAAPTLTYCPHKRHSDHCASMTATFARLHTQNDRTSPKETAGWWQSACAEALQITLQTCSWCSSGGGIKPSTANGPRTSRSSCPTFHLFANCSSHVSFCLCFSQPHMFSSRPASAPAYSADIAFTANARRFGYRQAGLQNRDS